MRKGIMMLLCVLVCLNTAAAHSGRTDADGGHYNRSTGEYHYHHGYSVHQHIGGVCPYDFDDRTGQNSGGNGGSSDERVTLPPDTTAAETVSEQSNGEYPWWFIWLLTAVMAPTLVYLGVEARCACKRRKEETARVAAGREEFRLQYEGKSLRESAGVPFDCEMDSHGLPHTRGYADIKADAFTVYITQSGSSYHTGLCRYASAGRPVNLCIAKAMRKKPCSRCKPMNAVPNWVGKYRNLDRLRKRYQVDMLP